MNILGIRRVERGSEMFMLRYGLAHVISGIVEVTSLGKMTTSWRAVSVSMGRQLSLRRFLESVSSSSPYPSRSGALFSFTCGIASIAEGSVEVASLGKFTSDWYLQWVIEGEDVIQRAGAILRKPKGNR